MNDPTPEKLRALHDWFDERFDEGIQWLDEVSGDRICEAIGLYCAAFPGVVADAFRDSEAADLIVGGAPMYFESVSTHSPAILAHARALASFATTAIRNVAVEEVQKIWEARYAEWLAMAPQRIRDDADAARYEAYREQKFLETLP